MAFRHGIYKSEVPTSLIAPVEGYAGLPVVFGTAPVHLASSLHVNEPVLCTSYSDAVQNFGYSDEWDKYTLCEFMHAHFALYGQKPAVLVNVLDPDIHSQKFTAQKFVVSDGKINLGYDVLTPLIEVASQEADDDFGDGDDVTSKIIYEKGRDYEAAYNDANELIITALTGGALSGKSEAYVTYRKLIPGQVTTNDLVGGVAADGRNKGLECISDVYPKFRLIPGVILAPGFSENPGVAAVMRAKTENINGLFSCICITDIPSDNQGAKTYSEVTAWKSAHSFTGNREITCWPRVTLDGKTYHLSTHIAGIIARTDGNYDDVPCKSPSNESMNIDGIITAGGVEVNMTHDMANYLNSQGVMTALNFANGWTAWGNRTAAYPGTTDVKDCFIPVRRMFDFTGNTFITTFWQKTDAPITLRLIENIINTFNLYLNGLTARGMLLGGRIEFQDVENATTDLLNGILRFHVFITPPVPAEVIEGIFEYDPAYLAALFN